MEKKITLYVIKLCPYCDAAKRLLKSKNIEYTEINVDGDDVKREWISRHSPQKTFPQLFVDNKNIGGFEDLQDLDKSGKLNSILGIKK